MSETNQAIFLSYAHEDAVVARRMADALRGIGCEVWFDEHELRGGDSWDAKIRQQIKTCALFLPVISAQTNARMEGYFRREWKLAVDRTHDMAEGMPYLLPVVVDETTEASALVPGAFREVQWVTLPRGLPGPDFVDTVERLLKRKPEQPAVSSAPLKSSTTTTRASTGLPWKFVLPVAAVLVVGLIWALTRSAPPANPATPDITPVVAETVAAVDELNDLSIAVMPLMNMSSNAENAYFAGGVHEDVMTNLTRVRGLEVVSRTTVLRIAAEALTLPEIGQRLNVRYIVEGSVRRIGNHVRVTVQLIDAREDRHLWASNFERELVDVFATQSELAKEISDSLHLEIQPETVGNLTNMPTHSVLAYDLYNKSLSLQKTEDTTRESMLKQIELLEQAVEEDPDFVEAWGVLKRRYDYMSNRPGSEVWLLGNSEDRVALKKTYRAQSDRALAKAVALDPDNVETLLSLAVNHIWPQPERVLQEQKVLFDRILAEHPNNAMGWYHLAWWYRHQEPVDDENAFVAFEEALKHDPFNARIVRAVLERYRSMGDRDNVARMAERLTQIVPEVGADGSLGKIALSRRYTMMYEALAATGDTSLMADIEALLRNDQDRWAIAYPSLELLFKADAASEFHTWRGNWEKVAALVIPFRDWRDFITTWSRDILLDLQENAIHALIKLDREEEARELAREVLALAETEPMRDYVMQAGSRYRVLVTAHHVLGHDEQVENMTAYLLENRGIGFDSDGGDAIRAVRLTDVDKAAEMFMTAVERDPTWDKADDFAIWAITTPDLLTHPRVKEFYVQQGKWLPYLAERLPEYAEYAEQAKE